MNLDELMTEIKDLIDQVIRDETGARLDTVFARVEALHIASFELRDNLMELEEAIEDCKR